MEFSDVTKKYWEEKDWQDLEKVESVNDLRTIALRIINRMDKPFVQVCGPVATGGFGSVEKNLDAFNEAIIKLQGQGLNVFDQMPFETPMQVLKKKFSVEKIGKEILNDFYLPIFESGMVSTFYFMSSWQTSLGSKWEHEKAKELGIEIIYL
ncbi:MAG: hypothetical protein WC793_01600 [Candidatus Paceibacterota bacterium]|jgi:hypothetical protein